MNTDRACPLCGEKLRENAFRVRTGNYHQCPRCDLLVRDRAEWLSVEQERAYYLTHENAVDDPGYRAFLAPLAGALTARLPPAARGLDYGAGAAPALAAMLAEAGFPTVSFDPFFAPDAAVLERRYDFITCTEVLEHMHHPARELLLLDSLLKPGGRLGVMTELRPGDERFADWHYHRDPTHVCFYSESCLRWIAESFGWELEWRAGRCAIFLRP